MSRYDLTDFEWRVIEPLLPNKPRGVPRVDDRRVLNGIFWVLGSGAPWRDLPERYGPRTICYNRFVRWRKAGVWDRHDGCHQRRARRRHPDDRQHLRSRPSAGRYGKKGGRSLSRSITRRAHDQDPRRRRRAGPPPIRLGLTARQTHDGQIADTLLNHLGPHIIVLADKAYDADRIRELIQDKGATPKSNRRWKPCFSKRLYRERNLIERFFSKLKHFRRVAPATTSSPPTSSP